MASADTSPVSKPYWGPNTSLYKSLDEEAARLVEQAIWLRLTGRMDAARQIYNHDLISLKYMPIIIIERAVLEQEAGRWGEAWRIVSDAMEHLENPDTKLDLPEYRLIALMRAMFGVRHRGDLDFAVQEFHRTREWLCDVKVSEYTDIQTSCIRFYTVAYLLTRLSSNFHEPTMEKIPLSESDQVVNEPWQGLHDLRRSLIERRMFNEASALFRVELNRTPPTERDPIVKEFLDGIADLPSSFGKDFMESSVRLQWASTYAQISNAARAIEELAESEAAFTRWCQEFGIVETWTVPQFHAILTTKLDFLGDEALKLQVAEDVAGLLEKTESSKTGSILSTATESAYSLFQATEKSEYMNKFFALHQRLEKYDAEFSEDLCDLVMHRNSLISATSTNLVDRQKSLEWIDGFFSRYPYFQSPGELESLYRRKSLLLRALQRFDESNSAEEIADKLKGMGPALGKWLHSSFGGITKPNSGPLDPGQWPDEEETEGLFFQPWTAVAGDPEKVAKTACNLLSAWAIDDVESGHITATAYEKMFNTPYQDLGNLTISENDSAGDASIGQRKTLMTILIPPDSSSAEDNNVRFQLVLEWLSEPPKGQLLKRLFGLLMLLEARQYHFSDQHLWDLRIQELEHIMKLHTKLPPSIQAVTKSQPTAWAAALTSTYIAKFWIAPDVTDPVAFSYVLQAEKYSLLTIEKLRTDPQPGQLLIHQRIGAQICLLKIARLEEQLKQLSQDTPDSIQSKEEGYELDTTKPKSSIEEEIKALRQVGLEKIEESEQISTASELEASWSDGLGGVTERERVSKFQLSFLTVQNALHLLLTENELTPETVKSVWDWVQKYKARSLARTIGIRSGIPPSLLAQIQSSPEATLIYEQMLELEKSIDAAHSNARFDLRQQLDVVRSRMKHNPILRRLVDLRQGSPLDLSDIDYIEERAGQPVVFVDWFYLPPYPEPGIGRLLLLTARSGAEPTLDILTTTLEDVHAWQNEFLEPQKLTLPETRLEYNKQLSGLVAPLVHRSQPNDLLVFCPSVTLHRLPLHALNVATQISGTDDQYIQPVIHRNPVAYIHSLSLLRSSMSVAEGSGTSLNATNPQFMAGISEADATAVINGRQANYTAGRASIKDLAALCGAVPLIDKTATKEDFMRLVTQSRLLHLHTHCNWNFSDPLDHHIEFPKLDETETREASPDLKLTAKEIFEIQLLPGTHVNMIACQGGLMEVKMGDEVMGLVPALLYSGATSTVSTLWSIADSDGAQFSRLFFDSFVDQCQEQSENRSLEAEESANVLLQMSRSNPACFVDMALALQDAVMEIDPHGHEPLYGWAAFVLHGYWLYPVPQKEVERFGQNTPQC